MKITLDMPNVESCSVSECAYNIDSDCRAKAITVGGGITPACDTFFDGGSGHTHFDTIAGVGACKITGCRHNDDLECMAENINVSVKNGMANCTTYSPR